MRILPRFYIPTLLARSAKGRAAVLLGLALLTLLAVLLSLRFGSQPISASQMLDALRTGDEKSVAYRILRYMRLPRTVAGLVAGGALALAGTLIQAVLNNVMASPNVIGVNAGAGFAAMLAVTLAPSAAALIPAAAFFGALCTALFIYLLAVRAGLSRTTLILAGVAVSSILTAGIDTLTLLYPDDVIGATGFMLGGRVRFAAILAAALLAGAAVSFAGLLGFVGLLVPHIARRLIGTDNRWLMPASVLAGGSFVLICDLAARMLFAPFELPVGIVMSLLGGPFFLSLLLRRRKRSGIYG